MGLFRQSRRGRGRRVQPSPVSAANRNVRPKQLSPYAPANSGSASLGNKGSLRHQQARSTFVMPTVNRDPARQLPPTTTEAVQVLQALGRKENGGFKCSAVWQVQTDDRERKAFKLPGVAVRPDGQLVTSDSTLAMHGVDSHHALCAEVLCDDMLTVMGPPWTDQLARVHATHVPSLSERTGLMIDWVDGQLAEAHPQQAFTEEGRRQRQRGWRPPSAPEQTWAQEIRQLSLIDTITGNKDRHGSNIMIADGHALGIDQGLAFAPDDGSRVISNPFSKMVVASGGFSLTQQEQQALQHLRDSDWLTQVHTQLGERAAQETQDRLARMLQTGRFDPFVLGEEPTEQ